MKIYLVALGAGLLVGIIYGLLQVRSPAPPIVALVGLLGILLGEQVVPLAKRVAGGEPLGVQLISDQSSNHVMGSLPCHAPEPTSGSKLTAVPDTRDPGGS